MPRSWTTIRATCPPPLGRSADEARPHALPGPVHHAPDAEPLLGPHPLDPLVGELGRERPREAVDVGVVLAGQAALGALGHDHHRGVREVRGEPARQKPLADHAGVAGREEADVVVLRDRIPVGMDGPEDGRDRQPPPHDQQARPVDQSAQRLEHGEASSTGTKGEAAPDPGHDRRPPIRGGARPIPSHDTGSRRPVSKSIEPGRAPGTYLSFLDIPIEGPEMEPPSRQERQRGNSELMRPRRSFPVLAFLATWRFHSVFAPRDSLRPKSKVTPHPPRHLT